MPEPAPIGELREYLVAAARAHHAATGGPNPQWAEWYAEYLTDDVNRLLGAALTVEELAAWLQGADRRYRAEDQTVRWPEAYAAWLLEDRG